MKNTEYIIYSPSPNSDDMLILNRNFEKKVSNNSITLYNLINNSTLK